MNAAERRASSLPLAGRVDASDLGDAKRRPESVGVGVKKKAPHPGLRFAPAFPPRRFAGGGINADLFVR